MNILIASGIYLGIEKDPCSIDADNIWKELTDIAVHDQNDIDLMIVAGHFFHLKMYQKDGNCDASPPLRVNVEVLLWLQRMMYKK